MTKDEFQAKAYVVEDRLRVLLRGLFPEGGRMILIIETGDHCAVQTTVTDNEIAVQMLETAQEAFEKITPPAKRSHTH
jgi:hypothetical protein